MRYYDSIKIRENLSFFYVWDEDGTIVRSSFDPIVIANIGKRENKRIEKIFSDYFFYGKPVNGIKYRIDAGLTDFEKKVLEETSKIPFGKRLTYKDIAVKIGRRKSYRAVGNALGKNPLPVIIPCHRVVAKTGLGGFTGGLHIKKILLKIESIGL